MFGKHSENHLQFWIRCSISSQSTYLVSLDNSSAVRMEDSMWNKMPETSVLWCFSGFGFLRWRFTGRDAGAHGGRVVGDPCWGHFLSNGLDLQKGNKASDKGWRMCGPYLRDLTPHLEANFLEERMQVVEQPAAIKEERRLQHLLVDLFIIQFLWWKNWAVTPK